MHEILEVPVLVIMRRPPRLHKMKAALLAHTRSAAAKWDLIQRAGDVERCGALYLQRIGIEHQASIALLRATTLRGHIPEPLRLAHLIAGGVTTGRSRGRV